jgi:hypothetical protein
MKYLLTFIVLCACSLISAGLNHALNYDGDFAAGWITAWFFYTYDECR